MAIVESIGGSNSEGPKFMKNWVDIETDTNRFKHEVKKDDVLKMFELSSNKKGMQQASF